MQIPVAIDREVSRRLECGAIVEIIKIAAIAIKGPVGCGDGVMTTKGPCCSSLLKLA